MSGLLGFARFPEGAAVVGHGWFVRLGRLRVMWGPLPDPRVTRVVMDEDNIIRLTISWQPEPK